MPATVETREPFPKETPTERLDAEVALRIKAGAVRSRKAKQSDGSWLIISEWNVIGEND